MTVIAGRIGAFDARAVGSGDPGGPDEVDEVDVVLLRSVVVFPHILRRGAVAVVVGEVRVERPTVEPEHLVGVVLGAAGVGERPPAGWIPAYPPELVGGGQVRDAVQPQPGLPLSAIAG